MHEWEQVVAKCQVLDHVLQGVFVLRRDWVVLFWNRCLEEWSRVARQAIVGQPIHVFYTSLRAPKYAARLHSVFVGGPPAIFSSQLHGYIIPLLMPNGRCRMQHTTVTSLHLEDVETCYALFSLQDVMTDLTQRVQVVGQRKNGTTFPMELSVSEVRLEGRRLLTGIARDITEWQAMERMKDDFVSVVSHELRTPLTSIRGALGLLSSALQAPLPSQAQHLLDTTVWVRVVCEADEAIFHVQDQGRGIPAEKLEMIFTRFQQVDASDPREKSGTGLGLTICRSIVQQHGGRIWVESLPGQGSTFFFTLPRTPVPRLIAVAPDEA